MGYDLKIRNEIAEDDRWFGANIWGMGVLREAMYIADVLDIDAEMPDCPDTSNITDDDEDAYDKVLLPWRSTKSDKEGKVPTFKFGSNDGWIVSPEECTLIAQGLAKLDLTTYVNQPFTRMDADLMKFIKRFGEFCELAAANGGFSVH